MIRLILVRHGNTFETGQKPTQVGAQSDLPLTLQGCEQARHFAHYLISEEICPKAVYAGSLKRQIKTAQIISENLHLESQVRLHEAALTEIDYGAWEGLTSEEISSKWPHEYSGWTGAAQWPKGVFGRTQEEHLHDIKQWVGHLRDAFADGDAVVAVTSNGVMRFFYSFHEIEWRHLGHERQMENLKVKTGCFCELHIFNEFVEIKSWNLDPQNIVRKSLN